MSDHAVILVVEDQENDILLLRRAFASAAMTNPVHIVRDGEEALAYLTGEGKYSNRAEHPLPDVVLTSSDQIRDINKAYEFGANSFLVKEFDFQNFVEVAKLLQRYWMKTVKTPETSRAAAKPT